MRLDGVFTLIALMDGTTVNGTIRVEGTPLVQRYNEGTAVFIPNFETLAENNRPTVVVILRDISDGGVLVPNTIEFRYNDLLLTFDSNGLSTNAGMVGFFKKIDAYSTTVGGATYKVPALRVMKNLVPISNYDNDRITVSGTVEIGGSSIEFKALSKEVVIQESTGNQYDVLITNNKGSQLLEDGESLTDTARIFKDGVEITDYTGFTFQWVKMLGDGETNWGTSRTQAVSTNDVDNVLKLRCDVKKDGSLVASGYDEITDFSDPYYTLFKFTGISGNVVKKGETATVTPVAAKRSTGKEEPSLIKTWTFSLKDNTGAAFVLTGKDSATFTGANAKITYEDMVRAKMGLSGTVSGTA
nr:MAG TPA: minor structural protein [Caudoviricetes sp.]